MKIKERIANALVRLARKIDPPNNLAMAFIMDKLSEAMITGRSAYRITGVDQDEMYVRERPQT